MGASRGFECQVYCEGPGELCEGLDQQCHRESPQHAYLPPCTADFRSRASHSAHRLLSATSSAFIFFW